MPRMGSRSEKGWQVYRKPAAGAARHGRHRTPFFVAPAHTQTQNPHATVTVDADEREREAREKGNEGC